MLEKLPLNGEIALQVICRHVVKYGVLGGDISYGQHGITSLVIRLVMGSM